MNTNQNTAVLGSAPTQQPGIYNYDDFQDEESDQIQDDVRCIRIKRAVRAKRSMLDRDF